MYWKNRALSEGIRDIKASRSLTFSSSRGNGDVCLRRKGMVLKLNMFHDHFICPGINLTLVIWEPPCRCGGGLRAPVTWRAELEGD
ncbi:hypothetical protein E2C01_045598 [Portunus trituberculatus]|uniref:Uncharacterized protein n=1 Tax=Portunus trituberculatus TaxID=210409 RepID=A0A5B7G2W7_PORTR|nr:hypothetical protein [Portunus trituberculatus]